MFRFRYILVFALLITSTLFAQETLKIMSYNILNYPDYASSRDTYFRDIMEEVSPDVLVVNEIKSQSAVNRFAEDILGEKYSAGDFIQNGSHHYYNQISNAIFYKDSLVEFISNTAIKISSSDGPRDLNKFKIVHNITEDTLLIYSVHLKASNNSDGREQRESTVEELRKKTNALPIGTNFLICGDFNLYYASEAAYQDLLDMGSSGYVLDPISSEGYWHNNSDYKSIHTQSPRTTQFQGGSHGGMDDRFDFILISQAVKDQGGITYLEDSYKVYGNDGFHFNDAINDNVNYAVSRKIADALHNASDHLPVIAEFEFDGTTDVDENNLMLTEYRLQQNYPNPFNPSTTINFSVPEAQNVKLELFDILGNKVDEIFSGKVSAGNKSIEYNAGNLSSGVYVYRLFTNKVVLSRKLLLLK